MAVPSRVPVPGTSGDDLLVAPAEPSRLVGGAGDDILIDSPGSDALVGGAGHNRLYGGLGSDYYTYDLAAAGRDEILDFDPSPSWVNVNLDTLIISESLEEFGPFERRDDDLLIGLSGEPGVVTVKYFFLDPAFRIEIFRFGNTVITDEQILRNFHIDPTMPIGRSADNPPTYTGDLIRLTGNEQANRLAAADRPTYLLGRGGNDLLIGSRHGDVLNGGSSKPMFLGDNRWNRLYGGPGNDYYQVDSVVDFGDQQIYDYDPTPGNLDTLQIRGDVGGAAGVHMNGVAGGDLIIELYTEQRIVISNYFLDRAFVVEKIVFDDGSVLDEAAVRQRVGLPAALAPQASLSTPPHCCADDVGGDAWLNLTLLAGAALGGG
ncbi:calcium-binding protein [Pseudomonas sp. Gutcm_11s]|uniref:calcium-binding protein n=1 Tax=Pseudomonas sp. Gutcm_11s TaxID=3026088 RepID=UPI00236222A7|nr:calcium-binding protein [Pseudomonas sp. Gutcm_11s]MDD0845085.1 calcium-binding protein [Pseudomonas sp. Gutcm_11s]